MGLFKYIENRKRKKENEKYFVEEEQVQKPIRLEIEKGNYVGAYSFAKETYQSDMFYSYCSQTKLVVCLRLIDICYKLKKDDEVDIYINTYKEIDNTLKFHKDRGDSYYEIGKVMFENGRKEKAREFLQIAYDMSKGILFSTKEAKEKYLSFLNVKDDREFEDFSEDY